MRRALIPTPLLVLIALALSIALAQSSSPIAPDIPVRGAVTEADRAPSFFFSARQGETYTVLIEPEAGLVPLALIAQADDNAVIGSVTGAPGLTRVFAVISIRRDGEHYIQVQGANGTTGPFTLTLAVGSAILTPTATPIPPTELTAFVPLLGMLSPETPTQIYAVPASDRAQTVTVTADAGVSFSILTADGMTIGAVTAPLTGGSFFIPPGLAGVRVRVDLTGDAHAVYSVGVGPTVPIEPTPEPTATPTAEPTATPAPSDVDLVLNWGAQWFVLTNTSGLFLDIHDLTLRGGDRRAEAGIWERTGTVNIFALPPATCVGLRPLTVPEAPPLPTRCDDLAAWWASDAFVFWTGETFDVLFAGTVLQTCQTDIGQCFVDLPNA
ncbi:MAG: hypothetical protein ACUVS2_06935 [Candidatus Flexifilum sp.]